MSADIEAVVNIVVLALVIFGSMSFVGWLNGKQPVVRFAAKWTGIVVAILIAVSALTLFLVPSPAQNAGESSDGVERLDI